MSEAGLRRRLESKIGHRAPPLVYKRSSYHQAVLTATVPHIICHPWSFTSRPVEIVRSATPFIAIASNGTVLPPIPLLLIFHNNSPHFSCPGGGNPCRNRPRVFLRQPSPSAPFMVHDYTPWAVSMRTWAGVTQKHLQMDRVGCFVWLGCVPLQREINIACGPQPIGPANEFFICQTLSNFLGKKTVYSNSIIFIIFLHEPIFVKFWVNVAWRSPLSKFLTNDLRVAIFHIDTFHTILYA
jgi:hypothetical protein